MKPAVLADPLVGPPTAGKAKLMELFVVVAVTVAAAAVGEIVAEVAAALELVEVRVVESAVAVAAAAVLAVDEECCYSSSIVQHCWQVVGRLIE
jgi:hypothetical protein